MSLDFAMTRIAGGTVTLHDARRKRRWSVELEPFEIGTFAVTEEQFGEVLGEGEVNVCMARLIDCSMSMAG